MRRGRIFFYLALIVLLSFAAFAIIWVRYIQPQSTVVPEAPQPTAVIDTVNVIIITQRVPRGGELNEEVLGMVPIQRDLFIEGMLTDVKDVEGKLAKFDLDPGIPLTGSMLVDSAAQISSIGSDAALLIPRGMVAISIPIDQLSSVSYAPQPGDHVNVIASMKFVDLDSDFQSKLPNKIGSIFLPGDAETEPTYLTAVVTSNEANGPSVGKVESIPGLDQPIYSVPSEDQRSRLVAQTLLQDVMVLRVGEFPFGEEPVKVEEEQPEVEEPPPAGEGSEVEIPAPNVITLIVNPQDAVTLHYLLENSAQLTLVLRSAQDDSRVLTEAVTLQFLLDQYNIPVPVKLPYGVEVDQAVDTQAQNP